MSMLPSLTAQRSFLDFVGNIMKESFVLVGFFSISYWGTGGTWLHELSSLVVICEESP